jgi:hypothetical protein
MIWVKSSKVCLTLCKLFSNSLKARHYSKISQKLLAEKPVQHNTDCIKRYTVLFGFYRQYTTKNTPLQPISNGNAVHQEQW